MIWWPLAVWLLIPENTGATRPDHIKLRQGRVIILAWQGSAPEGQMARVSDGGLYHLLKVRGSFKVATRNVIALYLAAAYSLHTWIHMRPELDWGQLYIFLNQSQGQRTRPAVLWGAWMYRETHTHTPSLIRRWHLIMYSGLMWTHGCRLNIFNPLDDWWIDWDSSICPHWTDRVMLWSRVTVPQGVAVLTSAQVVIAVMQSVCLTLLQCRSSYCCWFTAGLSVSVLYWWRGSETGWRRQELHS